MNEANLEVAAVDAAADMAGVKTGRGGGNEVGRNSKVFGVTRSATSDGASSAFPNLEVWREVEHLRIAHSDGFRSAV